MNGFSHKLIAYRKSKKFSQEDISAQLGISLRSYQRIESGEREISLSEIMKFAEIYGVDKVEFFQNIASVDEICSQFCLSTNIGKVIGEKVVDLNYKAEEVIKEKNFSSYNWADHLPICTKIISPDNKLLYMSQAGYQQLGIKDEEKVEGSIYPLEFYPEPFKKLMNKNMEEARKTSEMHQLEASVVDKNGNALWYHSMITPLNNSETGEQYLIISSIKLDTIDS